MAFRLRRGTDAERLLITPEEGELIYTTDTKQVYVGDGTTLGGNIVSEDLGLDDLDEVDISSTPPTNGQVLVWRTDKFVPETISVDGSGVGITEGTIYSIDIQGRVIANDSSVVVDPNLGLITANDIFSNTISADTIDATTQFTGDLVGNVSGNVTGNVDAVDQIYSPLIFAGNVEATTLTGDILYRDSTVFFNASDGNITANAVNADTVDAVLMRANFFEGTHNGPVTGDLRGSVFGNDSSTLIDANNNLFIINDIQSATNDLKVLPAANTDNRVTMETTGGASVNRLAFNRTGTGDLSADTTSHGVVTFNRDDDSGVTTTVSIAGRNDKLFVFQDTNGSLADTSKYFVWGAGSMGIGTVAPQATLDVNGPIMPGVYADATARDSAIPTPVAGMMVYVTDVAKHQGYNGVGWQDLY